MSNQMEVTIPKDTQPAAFHNGYDIYKPAGKIG